MRDNESQNLISFENLSPQRINCLNLLATGFSAKEIGEQLKLSQRTVESYLADIRHIYGFRNSKELIAAYYSKNIISKISKEKIENLTFLDTSPLN